MSAGGMGAIGPVSVRYAAQIRELLHAQALQRMAAAEEAARASADAERSARVEPVEKAKDSPPVETKSAPAKPDHEAPAAELTHALDKPEPIPVGQLVDIQA